MATAAPWTPSRRMQAAAAAERARVERELSRLTAREETLTHELELVRRARSALQDELRVLERLSRDAAEVEVAETGTGRGRLRVVSDDPHAAEDEREVVLRGAQIRETAVRILAATPQADQAVHYRTWYELLRQQGFVPAGKDPLATFLTQIGRSPVVRRSTAPGMYSLDLGVTTRMRARFAQLQAELRKADEVPSVGVDEIERSRETRASLKTEVASAQRGLAEALRSLGE
jgi:hypothetical protein